MENLLNDLYNPYEDSWKVEDDLSADWAVEKIKDNQNELKRFKKVADEKIRLLQEALKRKEDKHNSEINFFKGKLKEYFETVKTKDTKTLKKYELPSGVLKMKKAKNDFDYDKKKLTEIAENDDYMKGFIKTKKDFDWATFKKDLEIVGNTIVNKATGELVEIEGLKVIEKEEQFNVEVE